MPDHSSGEPIAIQRVQAREPGRLTLVSEAVGEDGRIGEAYSAHHDDLSPPLMWTGLPEAETYALIVQDPDAPTAEPFLHWAIWDIPGKLHGLPAGVPKRAGPEGVDGLDGAVQGKNGRGGFGYMGPKPPAGDGPHRYHFQLFAVDKRLGLPPTAPLGDLISALKRDAIASCELVGVFEESTDEAAAPEPRSFSEAELNAGRGGLDADDVDRHAPHDEDGVVRGGRAQ